MVGYGKHGWDEGEGSARLPDGSGRRCRPKWKRSEDELKMASGKVLQFDPSRGYGFVAADDGGEDIFLHASAFDGVPSELTPGTSLEFEIMAGDRGRKAFDVRFAEAQPAPQPKAVVPAQSAAAIDDEQLCDVLSQGEFAEALTEMLLKTIPALTGPQILEVRQGIIALAKKHGWVDV
jgi:CspA family cold shock protein